MKDIIEIVTRFGFFSNKSLTMTDFNQY